MSFLKDHLFLVVTGALSAAGIAALLVWINAGLSLGDERAELRTSRSSKMASLARGDLANQAVVEDAKRRVQEMRAAHRTVAEDFLARTATSYKVLRFTAEEADTDQPVDAFPIREELWRTNPLRLQFPVRYRRDLAAQLATLKPTTPPTAEELKQRADEIAERDKGLKPAPAAPAAPGQPAPKTPAQQAREELVTARATAGRIYADVDSLRPALRLRGRYNDDELYLAQIGLWARRDILAAIAKTNEEVRRQFALKTRRGVAASAVKHLVEVRVRGYAVGAGGAARPSPRRGPGGVPPGRAAAGGGSLYVSLPTAAGMGARGPAVPSLTQRVTNKLYDVIHYEFTVVAVDRELLRLYSNLLEQGYHTILNVQIGKPAVKAAARPGVGGVMGPAQAGDLYDYGPDPVVQVTVVGELLLLANFTRGRWDPEAGKWDEKYPPLMPPAFLSRLDRADANALRSADRKRLPAVGGMRAGRRSP